MKQEYSAFGSPESRLTAMKRTVTEHSVHSEVDIRTIVENAMDAYTAKQIEDAGLQEEFEQSTIALAQKVADALFDPFAERASDYLAVLVPALAYVPIIGLIVSQVGKWDTPIPSSVVFLAAAIPAGLGLALGIVSFPRRPLGILKELRDTIERFTPRLPVGAAITGLVLTGVATLVVLHNLNTQRETRLVSFNYAKTTLVDKSLSTMKELQFRSNDQITLTQPDFPLGVNNVLSIKTQKSSQTKTVKYVIDDKGAFPGQLEADVGSRSGTVSWNEDGTPEIQTQIYVCSVNSVSGSTVIIQALASDNNVPVGSVTNQYDQSGMASLRLVVGGTPIELFYKPELINANALQPGDQLIVAYDIRTRRASRIDAIPSSTANRRDAESIGTENSKPERTRSDAK